MSGRLDNALVVFVSMVNGGRDRNDHEGLDTPSSDHEETQADKEAFTPYLKGHFFFDPSNQASLRALFVRCQESSLEVSDPLKEPENVACDPRGVVGHSRTATGNGGYALGLLLSPESGDVRIEIADIIGGWNPCLLPCYDFVDRDNGIQRGSVTQKSDQRSH